MFIELDYRGAESARKKITSHLKHEVALVLAKTI
jgi:hypothetical protein